MPSNVGVGGESVWLWLFTGGLERERRTTTNEEILFSKIFKNK